jgi:S1-C subfamily serine protease
MDTNKNKSLKRVLLIVGLILLSFCGGILGEIFTRSYLSQLSFFRDFYFTEADSLGQRDLVISQPKKVVVEQDIRLNQMATEVQPAVLGLYVAKKNSKNLSDNLYLPQDMLGQAFALTSDGWLISSEIAISRDKSDMVIYYNNKVYPLDKLVYDDLTGAVFIKINVQNLPVIKLADSQIVTPGQQVFAFDSYYQQLYLANVIDRAYSPIFSKTDLITSSESLNRNILINKNFPETIVGSPIFNYEGDIIGLWNGSGNTNSQVIPINYISPVINQVLKGEKIARPYLGLYYINLDQAVIFDSQLNPNSSKSGAYIQAVSANSPLAGKLAKGDIILSLENQTLDKDTDLADLLVSYKTGQEIKLKYLGADKETEISVTLK